MGSPSIFVYDCSNAGIIVSSFEQFAEQHEREFQEQVGSYKAFKGYEKLLRTYQYILVLFLYESLRFHENLSVWSEKFFPQKYNRGVVMVNFYACYVIDDCEKQNATVKDVAGTMKILYWEYVLK